MLGENGFEVERKLNLEGTPVAQAAIESGEIALYPEYTRYGGLLTVLKTKHSPASSDQASGLQNRQRRIPGTV